MRTTGRIPRSWYESPWRIAGRAVWIAFVVTLLALIAALLVAVSYTHLTLPTKA